MWIPLIILSIFSIFIGYFTKEYFIGEGISNITHLNINSQSNILLDLEHDISDWIKLAPLITTLLASIITILYLEFVNNKPNNSLYRYCNQRFYFEYLLNKLVIQKNLRWSKWLDQDLDKGFMDRFGPSGISESMNQWSQWITKIDQSSFMNLAIILLMGIIFMIFKTYEIDNIFEGWWMMNQWEITMIIIAILPYLICTTKKV
jgi:NADH-ubiquinone oxidoreductase chain 5